MPFARICRITIGGNLAYSQKPARIPSRFSPASFAQALVKSSTGSTSAVRISVMACSDSDQDRSVRMPVRGSSKRSEEHTSELQSPCNLVCRLLLEKKKKAMTYDA